MPCTPSVLTLHLFPLVANFPFLPWSAFRSFSFRFSHKDSLQRSSVASYHYKASPLHLFNVIYISNTDSLKSQYIAHACTVYFHCPFKHMGHRLRLRSFLLNNVHHYSAPSINTQVSLRYHRMVPTTVFCTHIFIYLKLSLYL